MGNVHDCIGPKTRSGRSHPEGLAGLLHAWPSQDCSLFAKRLLYAPIRLPQAPPWPSLTGRAYASMMPSRRSDRYSRYVRYIAPGALYAAIRATAVHEVSGARLLTVHTAFTNTCHCTRTSV